MKRVILLLSVALVTGCAAPPPPGELQPTDFAQGRPVVFAGREPFFRVNLPVEMFTETAWPDLRDVRVFNSAAESVPFARVVPSSSANTTETIALRQFRLAPTSTDRAPQIELEARSQGVELRIAPGSAPAQGAEYILATAETDLDKIIERLRLSWLTHPTNWQQRVTVSISPDLQTWTSIAVGRPVMDLKTDDGDRLVQNEVAIAASARERSRYWKIQFAPGFSPKLTGVEGETTIVAEEPAGVTIEAAGVRAKDGSLIYELPTAQPIKKLQVKPAVPNSVLSMRIDGRLSADAEWQPLASAIVYRLNAPAGGEDVSPPLRLNGRLVRYLRIRPIGAGWGTQLPTVEAERDQLALIVNARGGGPYLMAWGSRAASDVSLPIESLVPGYRSDTPMDLPMASLEPVQTLGGPSRLTDLAPAERSARWQTTLIWVLLIGGAAALLLMAFKLWREMSNDS